MELATLTTILLWLLAASLVILGIAGLALPALPGAPLLFGGLVVAAWAEDFAYLGTGSIVVLAVLALLTYPVDILAGALGAQKFGASKKAMVGAGIGAVVGIFIGPFVGAMVGELMQQREVRKAGLSGIGATLGLLLGAVAKLAIAFMMIALFLFMRFS
jgi:uncharacterized protein YqgC (DUF456 family)